MEGKTMLQNIIIPVIRNPVYIIASLISVLVYRLIYFQLIFYLIFYININPGFYGALIFGFIRETLMLIIATLFMAGIGCALKKITTEGASKPCDLIEGINRYFFRVFKVNLLIFVLSLIGISLIIKPNLIMGLILPSATIRTNVLIGLIVAPFLVSWYPAMFIDDLGAIESIKKALSIGVKAYLKLVFAVFIPLAPSFIYAGYYAFPRSTDIYASTASVFSVGYYVFFGASAILSLFALFYIFKIYYKTQHV